MKKLIPYLLVIISLASTMYFPVSAESNKATSDNSNTYDANAAIEYAETNCYDADGNCAQFVSACLRAGGISVDESIDGCTSLYRWLVENTNGETYHVSLSRSSVLPIGIISTFLAKGDVVLYYCSTCASYGTPAYLHAVLYSWTDSDGLLHGFSHNPEHSDQDAYFYYYNCYECDEDISDVYIYHFTDSGTVTDQSFLSRKISGITSCLTNLSEVFSKYCDYLEDSAFVQKLVVSD